MLDWNGAQMDPFYVTTPIYYVNDKPHIGHAYSTITADLLARFAKILGHPTRFLTGLDEHGQKIERRAQEEGLHPKEFVDRMAEPFRTCWTDLHCETDDFIRTTETRHRQSVVALWQRLMDRGDIYLGEYEGWYSVSLEQFLTEKELLPGNLDPINKKPVERVKEQSYFFRLSKYQEPLLEHYENHPGFVQPESRFNEVKRFVEAGLKDLSISRNTFRWGIPVPEDQSHVMYVWLDALTNYISALGAPRDPSSSLFERFWPSPHNGARAVHIVGKDILRFHAVYWPAFVMSAGITPATRVLAHGWLTVNGEKMSKSAKNFLPPAPIVRRVGADALRYYLVREVALGQDGDFNEQNLIHRYNGDLGNGLGNLLNRMVASIVKKSFDGRIPAPGPRGPEEKQLVTDAKRISEEAKAHLSTPAPHRALESIWEFVVITNRYVDRMEPWKLSKGTTDEQLGRLRTVTYTVLEALRWLSVMLWPILPKKCDELRGQLGLGPIRPVNGLPLWPSVWGGLRPGTLTQPGPALFPRMETTTTNPSSKASHDPMTTAEAKNNAEPKTGSPDAQDSIQFDDFMKVELRVAEVKSAERVPKSDKLLRLQVDVGEAGQRQILAGIGKSYEPEQLVGKRLVVVSNLKPRKMMGLLSEGMVLATGAPESLSVLGTDADKTITPGTRVS